jgi:hypothetical protein
MKRLLLLTAFSLALCNFALAAEAGPGADAPGDLSQSPDRVPGPPGACAVAPLGLVSWWRAEGDTLDAWGSNDLSAQQGIGFGPGEVGQAFSFIPAPLTLTNSFLRGSNSASLSSTNALSIEAWVYPTAPPASAPLRTILSKWDPVEIEAIQNQSSYYLALTAAGDVVFRISQTGSPLSLSNYSLATPTPLPTNQWSFIVATFEGAHLTIYTNGTLAAQSASLATNGPVHVFAGTDPLGIGAIPSTVRANVAQWFWTGLVDEVTLYNRDLSAAEIAAIYNAGNAGKCLSPPVILAQPQSQSVGLGQSAQFSVSAMGIHPLRYQWQFNGSNIAGATDPALRINNVQTNDAGFYSVLVSNPVGATPSSNAFLTVLPTPTCQPLPSGAISWWPADGYGSDVVGTNHLLTQLTIPQGPPPVYSNGIVGQAWSFNGSSAALQVADSPSLNFRSNADFSIETWILANSLAVAPGGSAAIISKRALGALSDGPGYMLWLTNGNLAFWLGTIPSCFCPNTFANFVSAGADLRDSTWHHVAVTLARNSPTGGNLFVDGQTVLTFDPTAHKGDLSVTQPLMFGSSYNGLIDEPAIYARALSPAEVLAIYQANSAGKCKVAPRIVSQPQDQTIAQGEDATFNVSATGFGPLRYQWLAGSTPIIGATNAALHFYNVTSNNAASYSVVVSNFFGSTLSASALLAVGPPPVCIPPPPGLLAWYPADGFGTDVVGTNDAPAAPGYATGKVGLAFSFPDYGVIQHTIATAPLNFGSNADFSIEAWVESQRIGVADFPNQTIASKVRGQTQVSFGTGYSLWLSQGRLAFSMGAISDGISNAATFASTSPDLRDGHFHHVAVSLVRSATNGGNLYVDGQVVLTFDPTPLIGSLSNNVPLVIGNSLNSSGVFFYGLIDELSFYERALSPGEVLAIKLAGAGGKCKPVPVITVQPASRTVLFGSNVTFNVAATGTRLHYQWFHNGSSILNATNPAYSVFANSMSAGRYSVLVSNLLGSALSSNAVLTIDTGPLTLCTNVVVAAGSNCHASASIDAGSYSPSGVPFTTTQLPPGPYPLGATPVRLTATDTLGLSSSCTGLVVVVDFTSPTIACPANVAASNDLNRCGAVVNYPLPVAADDCSGIASVVCVPPPGSFFPVGLTVVVCTATDGAGNQTNCTFTVSVRDAQPPAIACPVDITVTNAHDAWTSVVAFSPTAADNCDPSPAIVCSPASGSAFALGTNTVTCTATDAAGNATHCAFRIVVLPGNQPPVPIIQVRPLAVFPGITNLIVIAANNSNAPVILDGSKSYDPDDNVFNFAWYEGTNLFSTNMIVTDVLAVGSHTITLRLDDTFPLGTNSANVTVDVVSPAQSVALVIEMVENSQLPHQRQQSLVASLQAAAASFDAGRSAPGLNQLRAFQNKVQAQVAPIDPLLAAQLLSSAQVIIDALAGP